MLDKDGSIQNYFKKQAPAEGAPYGISPEVMDNYIKSCGESEPCYEETCFLHKFCKNQRRRSASRYYRTADQCLCFRFIDRTITAF